MGRSVFVALGLVFLVGTASASAQVAAVGAGIHAGTCDDVPVIRRPAAAVVITGGTITNETVIDISANAGTSISDASDGSPNLGQAVIPLLAPALADGEPQGNDDFLPAANSFTTVQMSLERLSSEDHAVVVSEPGEDAVLACGEIGGPVTDSGALVIGLSSVADSGVSGIAYLAPDADPAQTNVSLFIAGEAIRDLAPLVPVDVQQDDEDDRIEDAAAQPVATQAPRPSVPPTEVPVQSLGISADEQAYLNEMGPIATTVGESLGRAAELSANPRLFDEDWQIAMVVELALWQFSYQQASELTPPPALAAMHAQFLEALRLLDEAADHMATGLDTLDSAEIDLAARKIGQAGPLIAEAERLLTEFATERGR